MVFDLDPKKNKKQIGHCQWINLPPVIWELVLQRLSPLTPFCFRSVCTAFRSMINSTHEDEEHNQLPHNLSYALLMFFDSTFNNEFRIFNPKDSRTYAIRLPIKMDVSRYWAIGSSFGYLFMSDFERFSVSLLNPFTKTHISLPPLNMIPPRLFRTSLKTLTLSEKPSINKKDFFVIATIFCRNSRGLYYCRPSQDKKWKLLPYSEDCTNDNCIFVNGKLYALDHKGVLHSWDFSVTNGVIKKMRIMTTLSNMYNKWMQGYILGRRLLAKSTQGQLLMLQTRVSQNGERDADLILVQKFDEKLKEWKPEGLSGEVLLIKYGEPPICLSKEEHQEFAEDFIVYEHKSYSHTLANNVGVFALSGDFILGKDEKFSYLGISYFRWITPNLY